MHFKKSHKERFFSHFRQLNMAIAIKKSSPLTQTCAGHIGINFTQQIDILSINLFYFQLTVYSNAPTFAFRLKFQRNRRTKIFFNYRLGGHESDATIDSYRDSVNTASINKLDRTLKYIPVPNISSANKFPHPNVHIYWRYAIENAKVITTKTNKIIYIAVVRISLPDVSIAL